MLALLIIAMLALNGWISWRNAVVVGRSWADSKAIGGWVRFLTWCAAIMSACGFTSVFVLIVTFFAAPELADAALKLGFALIILPVIGSGLGLWLDSVTTACRVRTVENVGTAAYNTFAIAHDTYQAASALPDILTGLGELFSGADDGKHKIGILAVVIVIAALCLGIFTTVAIVRRTAREYSTEVAKQHGFKVKKTPKLKHAAA